MSDDERRPNLTVSDSQSEPNALPRDPSQKIHKKPRVFIHKASEDPEEEARIRANTSVIEAARTISIDDFSKVHQTPCFRDAVMPGIGLGTGLGALRFVVGGSLPKSLNFGVGTGLVVAIGGYQLCQNRRQRAKDGMKEAVKVLEQKEASKSSQAQATINSAEPVAGLPAIQGEGDSKSFWRSFKFW